MTKYAVTVTANQDYYICDINKKRDFYEWFATLLAYGTFGGGTLTYKISPDGGATKITLKDASGTNVTSAAEDNFTMNLTGSANNGDAPELYVTMAGSAGANVNVVVYDNNG